MRNKISLRTRELLLQDYIAHRDDPDTSNSKEFNLGVLGGLAHSYYRYYSSNPQEDLDIFGIGHFSVCPCGDDKEVKNEH